MPILEINDVTVSKTLGYAVLVDFETKVNCVDNQFMLPSLDIRTQVSFPGGNTVKGHVQEPGE